MICKNCNVSIPEGAAFCPPCRAENSTNTIYKTEGEKCLQCGAKNTLEVPLPPDLDNEPSKGETMPQPETDPEKKVPRVRKDSIYRMLTCRDLRAR